MAIADIQRETLSRLCQQRPYRCDMGIGQIADMDIVAHAASVRCGIIGSCNHDAITPAAHRVHGDFDKMRRSSAVGA